MGRFLPRFALAPLLAGLAALSVPDARAAAQAGVCAACDSTQRASLARALRGQLEEVQAELVRLRPELERLGADIAAGEPLTGARAALVLREHELRGIEQQLGRALARLDLQRRRTATARAATPRAPAPQVRVRVSTADAPTPPQSPAARGAIGDAERVAASGYIGVSFSGAIEPAPGVRRFFFHDYPQIVSVDAGSPAERGGLQAGDVLVTLAGTELKGRGVDLNAVLRPGAKVPVRFRRDGTVRSATLVVARTPTAYRRDPAEPVLLDLPDATVLMQPGPLAPRVVEEAPTPAMAPLPPIFATGGMTGGVAGAEVAKVQGNLREMLGVDGGVLVLDVGMGTPAARAGLRAGDVIQRADGETVRVPNDLVRAIRDASGGAVKLELVRKKERKTVVLRW